MKQRILILLCSLLPYICFGQDMVSGHNNVGLGSFILKNNQGYIDLSLPRTDKTPSLYAIISSTTGVSGFSKTILTDKGSYFISQSIGQSSVIGTFNKNGFSVSQGFQQGSISARLIQPLPENNLKVTLYPNPFHQSINISFDEPIVNGFFIKLSDMTGRILLSQKNAPTQLLNLPLTNLPNGIYILKINTEDKVFIANLIKQ